jgi:hypothetical protein
MLRGGQAEGVADRRSVVLELVGGGTFALLFAMRYLLFRLPAGWFHLPNRDCWLATEELALRANLTQSAFANRPFLVILGRCFVFAIAVLVLQFRALAVPPS